MQPSVPLPRAPQSPPCLRYPRIYTYPTGSPHGLPYKSAAARRSEIARPEVTRLLPSTHVSSLSSIAVHVHSLSLLPIPSSYAISLAIYNHSAKLCSSFSGISVSENFTVMHLPLTVFRFDNFFSRKYSQSSLKTWIEIVRICRVLLESS